MKRTIRLSGKNEGNKVTSCTPSNIKHNPPPTTARGLRRWQKNNPGHSLPSK